MGEWSEEDRKQITAQGLNVEEVERQIKIFRRGVPPVRLNRPCRAGDGIVVIPETEQQNLLAAYEEARRTHRLTKFVPASGAASRMFREWYRCLDAGGFADEDARAAFAGDLRQYAFFPDLRAVIAAKGRDIDALLANREEAAVLRFILTEEGLDYGSLPKALLKVSRLPGREIGPPSRSTLSRRPSTPGMPETFPVHFHGLPRTRKLPSGRFCRG